MSGIPTKPTLNTKVVDFSKQVAAFQHGKCMIGDGEFDSIADIPGASLAGRDEFLTFLETVLQEISDLAENPGKESSKVVKLPTSNYVIEGKRTNTIELYLVGLTQERKDWLEAELNKQVRTIALLSPDGDRALIFNGMRWTYERETELNGLFNSTLSTSYSNTSKNRFFIIQDIPETV